VKPWPLAQARQIGPAAPISSLGHSVLVPAWIGGSWQTLVTQSSQASSQTSFYLAYIVALHCATALALLWFFRADWARIIRRLFASLLRSLRGRHLAIQGPDERLAWMIVLATIPVGLTGIALEHTFRTIFAKPAAAAVFLFINGLVLLAGERFRRAQPQVGEPTRAREPAQVRVSAQARMPAEAAALTRPVVPGAHARQAGGRQRAEIRAAAASDARIARLPFRDSFYVGVLQITALLAGISRSGVTMAGGLWRGLDHEDAARFAFLLATPPILAAGVLKLPSLAGSAGAHIHG
jgi:undecaprenyl-diphosphatase